MKKILCMMVLSFLLLSLSSCGQKNSDKVRWKTETAEQETASEWIELPTYTTIEDYEENLPKLRKIKNFIEYEAIQNYGEFEVLVILDVHKVRWEDCSYLYGLIDENGYHLDLYVYPNGKDLEKASDMEIIEKAENNADLSYNRKTRGVLNVENAEYTYYDGRLYNITWMTSSHKFMLGICKTANNFAEYKGEKTGLVKSLLNIETAPTAIAEFNSRITSD